MRKLTPNLIVASVEAALRFWRDRLGFEITTEVPHGEGLGFVILQRGEVSLMLQSRASLAEDVAALAEREHRAVLYIHVADLAPVRAALSDYPQVVPERTTFYGARELIVRDPDGNAVFLAAHPAGD
ncbi:VOC family protein [Haliangium ochraceum]|uniref:Glyoxalase/bleomycin resistance protein/dioxygenase n=1 Tax=Haliangium ochraceum (strain DSM 14365 / JCM 11303 / SMP-2) TaxID=502025 RepID=D0LMA8_HALO1|nr:VOC family protein [Haliangium ochraceum]ACY16814.1 Glyoxalase/bleomycin resistance protein/dioxygenase [Haliangium ochraceum DSM 14365]